MKKKRFVLLSATIVGMLSITSCYVVLPTYVVSFEANGGTPVASQTIKSGEKIDSSRTITTKEESTFDAWCFDVRLTQDVDLTTYTVSKDVTLYARWILNQLDTPQIELTELNDHAVVTWNNIEHASGYDVYVNDAKVSSVNQTTYTLDYSSSNQVVYVIAVDSSHTYKASEKSNSVTFHGISLSAPVIEERNNIVSWGAVDKADKYFVYVNEDNVTPLGITDRFFDLTTLGGGNFEVYVRAGFLSFTSNKSNIITKQIIRPDNPSKLCYYGKTEITELTWSIHNDAGGSCADGYDLQSQEVFQEDDAYISQIRNITVNTKYLDINARTYVDSGEIYGILRVFVDDDEILPTTGVAPTINHNNNIDYTYELDDYFNEQVTIKIVNEGGNHIVLKTVEFYDTNIVTFNTMGGSTIDPLIVKRGHKINEPVTPAKEDYIFTGWFKEEQLSNKWNFETDVVNEDLTIYAGWKINKVLDSPVLSLNGLVISWDAVEDATFYKVYLNGTMIENHYEELSYTASLYKEDQSFTAVACSEEYYESLPSNVVVIHPIALTAPVISLSSSLLVSWGPVANANLYHILVNDVEVDTTTSISYQLDKSIQDVNVCVFASNSNDTYADSPKSNVCTLIQDDPSKISYDGKTEITKGTWTIYNENGGPNNEGYDLQSGSNFGGEDAYIYQVRNITGNTKYIDINTRAYVRAGETYGVLRVYVNDNEILPMTGVAPTIDHDANIVYTYDLSDYFNEQVTIKILNNEGTHIVLKSVDYYYPNIVSFDSNGGSKVEPVKAKHGYKLTAPTSPTKLDYIFTGWYKDKDLSDKWDFNTDIVENDMTLYAGWDFNTKLIAPVISLDNLTISWEAVPHATYYRIYNNGILEENHYEDLSYTTYLYKEEQEFYVVACGEGWDDSEASNKVTIYPIALNAPEINVSSLLLLSWDLVPNADSYVIYIDDVEVTTITNNHYQLDVSMEGSSIYVIAVDSDETYTDSPKSNVCTLIENNPTKLIYDGKTEISKATWTIYNDAGGPNNEGYDLESGSNFGNKDAYISQVRNITYETIYLDVTARAYVRGGETYGVLRVYVNDNEILPITGVAPIIDHDNNVIYSYDLSDYFNEEVTIKILNDDGTHLVIKTLNFYNYYDVIFDSDGGTPVDSTISKSGSKISAPQNPTKEDYIFTGWYKDNNLLNKWAFDVDLVENDIILYAGWKTNKTLVSPVISLNDMTISWEPVNNATYYKIYVNGDLLEDHYEALSYTASLYKEEQTFIVIACGDDWDDSLPSNSVTIYPTPLDAPQINISSSLLLSWEAVTGADSYNVFVDNLKVESVNNTSCQLDNSIEGSSIYVIAVDEDETFADSPKSNELTMLENYPAKLTYDGKTEISKATWTIYNDAGGSNNEGYDLQASTNFGGKDSYILQARNIACSSRYLDVTARAYVRGGETYGVLRVYVNDKEILPVTGAAPTINHDDNITYTYDLSAYFNSQVTIKILNDDGTHIVLKTVAFR